MTRPLEEGLAAFLGEKLGREVAIENVVETSAGARRRNVLFDAVPKDGGARLELVATITPNAAILILPTEVETGALRLAEEAKVPVPHVHFVELDERWVGGPFFISTRVAGEPAPSSHCTCSPSMTAIMRRAAATGSRSSRSRPSARCCSNTRTRSASVRA